MSACDTQAGMIFIYPVDPVKKRKFLYYPVTLVHLPENPVLVPKPFMRLFLEWNGTGDWTRKPRDGAGKYIV